MGIIGREREKEIFRELIFSNRAEFITLYGRRRIGKTFLIEQYFTDGDVYFQCTGTKDGTTRDQLVNFIKSFEKTFYPGMELRTPLTWRNAFELLTKEIEKIPSSKKIVIFLDELPWLAKRKSQLLQNLDYFWNTLWRKIPNFKLIVCGSAASWMLEKLINAKGGLHNRITRSILLEPFTLAETKEFFQANHLNFTEKQILDIYMITGGVPYYLSHITKSKSIIQNINDLCFNKDGLLYSEFPRLFKSLFDSAELNLRIIRTISKCRNGISFKELSQKTEKTAGGRFKERLDELEAAGFIQKFLPYGKKKRDHFYKVIDEYSLFYLKWIEPVVEGKSVPKGINYWASLSKSPGWQSWAGYAFEGICYKHSDKIINKLKLSSIGCLVGNWRYTPAENNTNIIGAQIDLILDRMDNAITIGEIKYSNKPFTIDKSYVINLMNKIEVFKTHLARDKQVFLTMITVHGVQPNLWSKEIVNNEITLKDLF